MNQKPNTYNLLEEQWIPVLRTDGKCGRVGIREAFTQAGRIREIAASNPMDRVAILRLLLAVLYWCKGNPRADTGLTPGDSFPSEWFSKLDDNKDCFNLLGDGTRFYQDRSAGRPRAVTDLIQDIPTGNNFWHFRHSTDGESGLCPGCCAMGLLRLPLFSVSGLPDLKSGINGTPPVYVVPWGMSLLETLRLNWTRSPDVGEPAWTKPDVRPTPGEDVPLLTGLTLLSRRVLLHDAGPSGVCIGCGSETDALIRTCMFQSAGEQRNDRWNDPHVVYTEATPRKASRAADLAAPGKFMMDRPWPGLLARILEAGKFGRGKGSTSLLIVGFATDKAKNIDVWERRILLPARDSTSNTAPSLLEQWNKEGWRMENRVACIVRPEKPSENLGKTAIASTRPHVESKVSAKAGELIAGGEETWKLAASEYGPMMEMIAESLSPGFTAAAVERRRQLAAAKPYMGPKSETIKKVYVRKGGDK
jgi:CRISPR type I-E-associated protein CasA/Cse1